jgi:hypothetical protein
MAAILQLRQGSTSTYISQGPNIAEPFFDTGSNILVVGKSGTEVIKLTKLDESNDGSFSITGDLTASNAILSGDITIGGNIILGDDVTDDITISGQLDSDLIPKTDATYDLGSTTKKWSNLHVVSGSIDSIDLSSSLPSGVISGSSQLPSGIISGSSQLPSGVVSGSSQITYLDISSKPTGIVSGSSQVAELLPEGTLSGSSQVENILPSGIISGSEQLPSGLISGSTQLPSGVVSGSSQITDGSNIFSSSLQISAISIPGFQSERIRGNNIDGVLSGSGQLPDGVISGSSQISELTHIHSFTSSYNTAISLNGDDVTIIGDLTVQGTQTQLNTATLNIEDKNLLIASGAADSSAANGAGITIDGADKSLEWEHGTSQFVFDAQVSSSVGFKGDGSNLTDVTAEEIEYTNILNKPTLVSGSDQILGGTNIVSSSTQVINFLPTDTVSGSSQITDGSNIVSSSDQVLGATNIVSSSTQVINFLPTDTVSGSEQLTSDLDLRYPTIGGSNLLSSSNETFTAYSQSVDLRLENTLTSGSSTSQSLHTLVGNFPTSGSLGTAAFYNVSSSLADDPNVIPNVKAVYDYINNTIGAADITGVSASLGLSGGGDSGYVSLSLDTGSDHFTTAVQGIAPQLPEGVISGSSQISALGFALGNFDNYINWRVRADNGSNRNVTTNYVVDIQGGDGITTSQTDTSGLTEINVTLDTGSTHFSDAVSEVGAPSGTISGSEQLPNGIVSGSSQTIDHIESSTLLGLNITNPTSLGVNGELFLNSTTNGYSGLINLLSGSVSVFTQYATESDKMVNILGGSGYGLFLQPDNTTSKAWVIDTDGDFVSQGTGDVYAENIYSTSAISGSSLSLASSATIGGNISVGGTVDGIDIATDVAANTLKTGYTNALVKTKLNAETVVSGSGQIDVTTTSNYSSINQYTDSDNTTHLNSLGVISGSTIEGDRTFDDNLIVEGNLTVNGTTTSVNSNTVNIGDNIIVLNSDETGTPSQDAGIDIERGTSTNARIAWDESEEYWVAGLNNITPGLSKIITAGNVEYYTDNDNTTHLNSLGVYSSSLSTADITEISNLTANEGTQLENIDSVTISNTQWGYLGALNQGLADDDDVTFGTIRVDDATASTTKGTGALIVDGGVGIGGSVNIGGTLKAEGDIVAYDSSDRRLKDEIIPIPNPIEKINSIGGYSFVWNNKKQDIYKGKDYGVIAQEIEDILPELVETRENGYKAVKYDKIVSLLIEGIKELSKEVSELKQKINKE